MRLVFLLEERSMKAFLESLLPRILPERVSFYLVAHDGKSDLDRSLPRTLRAWFTPEDRFVVVRDQDSADCVLLKRKLVCQCVDAGRSDALVRIACRELEAWYLADLRAVDDAYGTNCAAFQRKAKFRDPDRLGSPSRELARLVPAFDKMSGARLLGLRVDITNQRSPSFAQFVRGVRRLAGIA